MYSDTKEHSGASETYKNVAVKFTVTFLDVVDGFGTRGQRFLNLR